MPNRLRILPILGTKTNVPMDDVTLLKPVTQDMMLAHDVGGLNVDYQRRRQSCSKAMGSIQWDSSATAQATKCLGLFHLYDGSNRNYIYVDNGKVYVFDGSFAPVDKSGSVTFSTATLDLYSFVQYGSYVLMADHGVTTPYKWKHGDSTFTKLIDPSGGSGYTQYKFRYMDMFQRRIVGVYSDQTNGDLEIRWTAALPSLAGDVEFPAANQVYRSTDDSITGVKRMGLNTMFLYGDKSIDRMEYYPNANMPFSILNVVSHEGATNHHSIVSTGDRHFLYNSRYGFCEYHGDRQFPAGGRPISEDIENWIAELDLDYASGICGVFLPQQNEVCWAVPASGAASNTHLFYYHILDRSWRREDKAARYVDNWPIYTDFTWNDLIALSSDGTWVPVYGNTWSYYYSRLNSLAYGNTNGHLYYVGQESATEAYRIEPIMDFGEKGRLDLLLEVWFGINYVGDYSIDVFHRSGNTEAEVRDAIWSSLGSINCNSPNRANLYCGKMARLHQLKWGTDLADERFAVNFIDFVYAPQGEY